LHPEFARLLEIVLREELGLTVETNGVLCTPETAAEIAKSENPFVSVSLDGADAATHEWVRGVKGSFDAAVQGVRNLVAAGIRPQVILSLMRGNVEQVEAIIRLAEALGAGSVKFNIIQPTGRGEKVSQGADGLEVAELIALGRRVETELAPTTPLALYYDYPMAFRPLSRIAGGDGCGTCGILGILGVIPSGQYALCGIGEQIPELVFGAVGADPLARVWAENAVLNELREGLPTRLGGVCAQCLMKGQCLGSCVAQTYYREGSFWAPFWFCEEAEAAAQFPRTRMGN
jgi:SynChlorMet cassette radical SAM/SPASM protein ScmF